MLFCLHFATESASIATATSVVTGHRMTLDVSQSLGVTYWQYYFVA